MTEYQRDLDRRKVAEFLNKAESGAVKAGLSDSQKQRVNENNKIIILRFFSMFISARSYTIWVNINLIVSVSQYIYQIYLGMFKRHMLLFFPSFRGKYEFANLDGDWTNYYYKDSTGELIGIYFWSDYPQYCSTSNALKVGEKMQCK